MSKVQRIDTINDEVYGYTIKCPACNDTHLFDVKRWTFNGDHDKPTFKPSMLSNKDLSNTMMPRCHSYVTDGEIEFLGDCTHALAGQTVPLEDFDE